MREMTNTCKVEGCSQSCWKEVCTNCGHLIRNGRLPEQFGLVKNPECSVEGCEVPRYTKKSDLCRGHYEATLSGRKPEQKRHKTPNHAPKPTCREEGCSNPSRSKGLCRAHYWKSRSPEPKTKPCATDECPRRTADPRGRCKKHRDQLSKYGFTWEGERPTEEFQKWRDRTYGPCNVPGCEVTKTAIEGFFCQRHRADASRKNLEPVEYIELVSIKACESCGEESDYLVTDHGHSTCDHRKKDEMCRVCIRGRLCNGCNTALGLLKEDPGKISSLLRYLETHS